MVMKRVLITGAGRGIGRACAELFIKEGYEVIAHYFKSEKAARELKAAKYVCAHISDPVAVSKMFGEIGGVDILINNAAIAQSKLFDTITAEEWNDMIGVNLSGTFFVSQSAARGMMRCKFGRIINISSVWGITGASMEVHYSAAKAGVIGLTKALAKELAPSGITVNCVAPGVVDTYMLADFTPADLADLKSQTPLGRIADPQEIAQTVFYLASNNASFITGQVISPNGGLVI